MNPTPDHLDPDHLDDGILSAMLDGDAGDGDAHLAVCDRCAGRQAELAAGRAAMAATPVEPLDELTRRRLVTAALRAAEEAPAVPAPVARSRWGQRHPALVGSAAAVLLAVLVGVPFVVGHDGGSPDTSLSAAPDAAREESATPFLGDLGDLTDRDRLRLRLSSGTVPAAPPTGALGYGPIEPGPSPAAGGSTGAPVPSAAPASGGLAGSSDAVRSAQPTAEKSATNSAADTFAADQAALGRDRADTDACVAALLDGPARGGRLTGSGTGTYRGRPAIVAAFELSGGTVAFVADRSGCAVLDQFAL